MSGEIETTGMPIPKTPMEWAVWGASCAASIVFGVIGKAWGLSKRLAAAETNLDAAKKDASAARAETAAARDACTAALTSMQTSLRAEIQAVAARADAAERSAAAATQTAQAAASGASNPAALRLAINDELNSNHRITTTEHEVRLLREAEQRGAENNLTMTATLNRILGELGRM